MAQIKDILAFLLHEYPHETHLSNARVTKMIYLADWHQAIQHRVQVSPIRWYFDNYGPFVWDTLEVARQHPDLFALEDTRNDVGSRKIQLSLKDRNYVPVLTAQERMSLRHVIAKTSNLNWSDFIRLVYSTYPIISGDRYTYLNLSQYAEEYAPLH